MVNKDVVKNKLLNLEEYINDLQEYEGITLIEYKNDKLLQRYLERTLHLALESILDIGNHIISDERLGSPDNNSDIINILADNGIIKENKDGYIEMAKFRNIIVHDYAKINEEVVINIINNEINDLIVLFKWYQEYIK